MKKIVLCGVGNIGSYLYHFLKYITEELKCAQIIGVIDQDRNKKMIGEMKILDPEMINELNPEALFIITPKSEKIRNYYINLLEGKNYVIYDQHFDLAKILKIDRTTLNREKCAFHHINGMDKYFNEAEGEELLNVFWGDGSVFKYLFRKLDLDNVIELACGRGRHVPNYIDLSGHITLVDILQKNIDICRIRFGDDERISYYKNQGFDLKELNDGEYTSIFSYDAMVHFELLDINSYLTDFYRVLKPGGKVLIHHSNFDAMYDGRYDRSLVYGRSFMNYKIFSYLALQAGFVVLDQQILRWHHLPDLDCVSLLEKPIEGRTVEEEYGKILKF